MTVCDLRPWKHCRRRQTMFSLLIVLLLVLLSPAVAAPHQDSHETSPVTHTTLSSSTEETSHESLAEPPCLKPAIAEFPEDFMTQKQRESGGILVHIIIVMYLCAFLGLVCEKYFVPSLELICEILHVPSDIAGATFMAIGTSAPELFSSVIGSFITEGDIGVGAIVGSAVFNVIGITGIAGLAVWKMEVPIDWYPVSRDCFAYTLSVLVLMFVLYDNTVVWYEAVIMVVMFLLYVLLMCFNGRVQKVCTNQFESAKAYWQMRFGKRQDELDEKSPLIVKSHVVFIDPKPKKKVRFADDVEGRKFLLDSNENVMEKAETEVEESAVLVWQIPSGGCFRKACWLIMWPVLLLLYLTIPDCKQPKWKKYYMITFLMSVVWIAAATYLSVWMVTLIGFTFGIPDSISGITVLAVGTSVPEIISSILVVRNGYGNMAICNLLGSNVFNIVFCLGAPWLIKTTLISADGTIHINSAALTYMTLTLLSTVVVLYIAFFLTKWQICWKIGIICVIMYLAFIGLACFFELDLMAGVSLPSCLF